MNFFLGEINQEAALTDDVTNSLHSENFPELAEQRQAIEDIKETLERERKNIGNQLKINNFDYLHMAQGKLLSRKNKYVKKQELKNRNAFFSIYSFFSFKFYVRTVRNLIIAAK